MRFGDEHPHDGQFTRQIRAWVEPLTGPPVSCEVCRQKKDLDTRAEFNVITDADEGLFVAVCRVCASGSVAPIVQVSEHREVA